MFVIVGSPKSALEHQIVWGMGETPAEAIAACATDFGSMILERNPGLDPKNLKQAIAADSDYEILPATNALVAQVENYHHKFSVIDHQGERWADVDPEAGDA